MLEGIAAGEHTERTFALDMAPALAEDRRRDISRKAEKGLEAAGKRDRVGGRPTVLDDDKSAVILARREKGESIQVIAGNLDISVGSMHKVLAQERAGAEARAARGRTAMAIDVLLGGDVVRIEDEVFITLLDNSVAGTYKGYERALDTGRIKFSDLVELSRKGDIPYSLFFAPLSMVQEQVRKKTEKLLAGISRQTFSIGSRAKVELRDVELIVKDLIRKQQLLRKHDPSLQRNRLVGVLRDEASPVDADASRLMSAIALSHEDLRACTKKDKALELMIERLEAKQVLVSRSVQHYMPQRLTHVKFSGMTVRDNKVPYIFLAGGDHGDDQEPTGRTIFTLALMTVLVARRIFAPMTWDGGDTETEPGREYDIAGAMLMPTTRMKELRPSSLDDMKAVSEEFKVTPSAVTVRAMRLRSITPETARDHLEQLHREYVSIPKGRARSPIHPENAVRKYNGRELTVRMLRALDAGGISRGEFCREVCLNHIDPSRIDDLRRAVG